MAKHIDTYLAGQVAGDTLVEYCKKHDIDFTDMASKIKENEDVFILGLMDSLGWGKAD